MVCFDVFNGWADVNGGEGFADFIEYVPVGGESGAWSCWHSEVLFKGLWMPHGAEYIVAVKVLI